MPGWDPGGRLDALRGSRRLLDDGLGDNSCSCVGHRLNRGHRLRRGGLGHLGGLSRDIGCRADSIVGKALERTKTERHLGEFSSVSSR